MWFKNLKIFRLAPDGLPSTEMLEEALAAHHFHPAGAADMQSIGWVAPRDNCGMVYALNGQLLLMMRAETKLLPSKVINQAASARALEVAEQQGFKPGRRQMKEIKEQITDELLPKAFSVARDTRVWLDTKNGRLAIDAASASRSDEALGLLAKSLGGLPATPLYVQQSPAAAMTNWLLSDEAPAGFSIDQDTELRSTSDNGAAVRYVRQSVDVPDAQKHVQAGKQCTRLALTWADRVSFVLTDALDIKRVVALDVLKEAQGSTDQDEAERFDSDFALMSGELSRLLADLVEALGGKKRPI